MTIAEIKKARENYNKANNEGKEGYNPFDQVLDDAAAIEAAKPIWSKEQTQTNRAAWNSSIRNLGPKITADMVKELESEYGFSLATLKCEIVKHNL